MRLPDSLDSQLRQFRRALTGLLARGDLLGAAALFLLAFAAFCLLERLLDIGRGGRAVFAGAAAGYALALLLKAALRLVFKPSLTETARLAQRLFPELGDRLQGAVELAADERPADHISLELKQAALEQVAKRCADHDFPARLDPSLWRRPLFISLLALACAAVYFAALPRVALNSAARFFRPWAETPRFTFARLAKLPARLVVPKGEPGELGIGLDSASAFRPDGASMTLDGVAPANAPFGPDGVARFKLPRLDVPRLAELRAGDSPVQRLLLVPLDRPGLLGLQADLTYPAYLKLPPERKRLPGGRLGVVEGGSLRLVGETERPLSAFSARPLDPARSAPPQSFEAGEFRVGPLAVGELGHEFSLDWVDCDGLRAATPLKVSIEPRKDLPPEVKALVETPELVMLENERLSLGCEASDDFGVKALLCRWARKDSAAQTEVLGLGAPDAKALKAQFAVDPRALGVPAESSVELEFLAVDYNPATVPASSGKLVVRVMSLARHAELLLDKLSALNERLDLVIQDEEGNRSGNADLIAAPKTPPVEAARKSAKLEASERLNQKRMEELSRQYQALAAEALRNQDIPADSLQDWLSTAAALKDLAGKQSNAAASQLQRAAQAESDAARRPALENALEKQDEILRQLQLQQLDAAKSFDDLAAHSVARRLAAAARAQGELVRTQRLRLPEVVGKRLSELGSAQRSAGEGAAAAQAKLADGVGEINDDMLALLRRRPVKEYQAVTAQMKELKAVESLRALGERFAANKLFQGVAEAQAWALRLQAWADLLKRPPKQPGDAGKGGKDGEMNLDMEAVVALGRILGQEVALRERSRAAERNVQAAVARRDLPELRRRLLLHIDTSSKLANDQREVAAIVDGLNRRVSDRTFRGVLAYLDKTMDEAAVGLNRLDTAPRGMAIGAETDVIDLLSSLFRDLENQSQGKSSMAAMMAALGRGAAGGGNLSGGGQTAGRAPSGPVSPAAAKGEADKGTGGVDLESVPADYRGDVEGYFNRAEFPADGQRAPNTEGKGK